MFLAVDVEDELTSEMSFSFAGECVMIFCSERWDRNVRCWYDSWYKFICEGGVGR